MPPSRSFLLDSNILIAFLAAEPRVVERVRAAEAVYVPVIALGELTWTTNGDVVLAALSRGEPQVAASLSGDPIAEPLQPSGEVAAGEIPRQPHAAMISSRT